MKKTYAKPALRTEQFDVEDVITVSGSFLDTVTDQFENLIGNVSDMLNSLGG